MEKDFLKFKNLFTVVNIALISGVLLSGCTHSPQAPDLTGEISTPNEISNMQIDDERLNTSKEWSTLLEIRDFDPYLSSSTVLRVVNEMSVEANQFIPEYPETGFYNYSNIYTTCSDGALSASRGRGTCSHHGGVAGEVQVEIEAIVLKIYYCSDNTNIGEVSPDSYNGHAFLDRNLCDSYQGVARSYDWVLYKVTRNN